MEYCAPKDRDDIVNEMCVLRIPITPVLDQDEVISSDIAASRGILSRVPDSTEGDVLHLA